MMLGRGTDHIPAHILHPPGFPIFCPAPPYCWSVARRCSSSQPAAALSCRQIWPSGNWESRPSAEWGGALGKDAGIAPPPTVARQASTRAKIHRGAVTSSREIFPPSPSSCRQHTWVNERGREPNFIKEKISWLARPWVTKFNLAPEERSRNSSIYIRELVYFKIYLWLYMWPSIHIKIKILFLF